MAEQKSKLLPLRLCRLRQTLQEQGLQGFIIPRADEHLGEYVPASAERLAWLTGFTGSAGLAIVLPDKAAVFTDGRYVLQLAAQTDADLWERRHITEEPPPGWVAAHAPPGARIGYDPLLISEDGLKRYTDAGIDMVAADRNPIDAIWSDRPPPPQGAAVPYALGHTGRSAAEKRAQIAGLLREAKHDAAVISDPASIAWLLNIRGGDIPYTPFTLGFALMHADGGAELFMDAAKVPVATRDWLGNAVSVAGREALAPALARLRGKQVRVDPGGTPVWFAQTLRTADAVVVGGADPCLLPKACKNANEQRGARSAHQRDAVAVCQFLHFLAENAHRGRETEMSAAARLLAFREQVADFRGESFPAISGAGEHGAIIHYRVTDESNRSIRPNEIYLIEFGCSVPGRDNGYHPHGVDRARRPAAGPARTGHPCAEGPYSDRLPGVSARNRWAASGCLRTQGVVARRPRLRPWNRTRRRKLSVGARGSRQPVAPRSADPDRGRNDPVE